jgi:hypothetical protein
MQSDGRSSVSSLVLFRLLSGHCGRFPSLVPAVFDFLALFDCSAEEAADVYHWQASNITALSTLC